MTDPLHEQVRTLEADLVMCREQLGQEAERAESYRLDVAAIRDALEAPEDADINQLIDIVHALTEQVENAQLPEPDHTNPAHLRFCAGLLALISVREGNAMASNHYGYGLPFTGNHLIDLAKHLEAAQQQADADEELIEKAARTLAFAVERNDDDVSESEMWGMCLTPESRFRYRNQARALLAANLLRDGDQKAESGPTVEGGISNGQLLAMEPERREEVIASLSLEVRRKLANIASLGASRLISSVIADRDDWRTRNRMTSARDFTDLAANLLRDGGEK